MLEGRHCQRDGGGQKEQRCQDRAGFLSCAEAVALSTSWSDKLQGEGSAEDDDSESCGESGEAGDDGIPMVRAIVSVAKFMGQVTTSALVLWSLSGQRANLVLYSNLLRLLGSYLPNNAAIASAPDKAQSMGVKAFAMRLPVRL